MLFFFSLVFLLSGIECQNNVSPKNNNSRHDDNAFDFQSYHSYNELVHYLYSLKENYRDLVKLNVIGTTYEGRKLYLLRMSSNPSANHPVILVDAAHHAKEWASFASILDLTNHLIHSPDLLKNLDWYIIPIVNPDGYEYSRNVNRLWRKNRSKQIGSNCHGVDLNRNYDYHWGESGVTFNPCVGGEFLGKQPFSERESNAVKNVMKLFASKIKLYLTLHTYGNYLLFPYGYKFDVPYPLRLKNFAESIGEALKNENLNEFEILNSAALSPAAGGSDDYAIGVVGIPYAFTVELTKGYGFEYPAKKLADLYKTTRIIFSQAAKNIENQYVFNQSKRVVGII